MNIPHKPGVFLELSFPFNGLDTRLDCGISHIPSLAVLWAMPFLLLPFLFFFSSGSCPSASLLILRGFVFSGLN